MVLEPGWSIYLNKESKALSSSPFSSSYHNDVYQQQNSLHWLFMLTGHSIFCRQVVLCSLWIISKSEEERNKWVQIRIPTPTSRKSYRYQVVLFEAFFGSLIWNSILSSPQKTIYNKGKVLIDSPISNFIQNFHFRYRRYLKARVSRKSSPLKSEKRQTRTNMKRNPSLMNLNCIRRHFISHAVERNWIPW